MRIFAILIAVLVALASPAAAAERGRIALTFDDLPALTLLSSQAYVDYANDMILRGLKKHHWPAIGFVNESKLDEGDRTRQIANLRKWRDAGMSLGNHTFSHESPNTIGAQAYVDDIARGEAVTRPLLAERRQTLKWFRHPYLETGLPLAEKRMIDDWLKAHGYRIAPVTMEASDWMFADIYDDAIARHDTARAERTKAEYLKYTDKMVGWYKRSAQQLLGRQIPYVILLHVTRLNADSMDDLAAILARHELRPVTLEAAMKDPAYEIRDSYVGPDGIEWQERWSMTLHRDLPWNDFADPPKKIQAEYDRIDSDNTPAPATSAPISRP
jgi:peptidoglycan/xylan/chitin deacetylase (PgdA/CDA1 family)